VIDPLGGRGTTPTQACLTNRIGIGNDLNPLAYILIKAKVNPPSKKDLLKRIAELESEFTETNIDDVPEKIRMLYSKKTLQQLVFFKETLNLRRKVDTFIMAVILGGMHGDSKKPNYMSIPMPNTFSMSPNYVKNFIKKHELKPPKHDAFEVIKYRVDRLYSQGIPGVKGKAYNVDIRKLPRKLKGVKGKLIVSSPPYLKVIRYGKFNWIRLWMLDIDPKELDGKLDDTLLLVIIYRTTWLELCLFDDSPYFFGINNLS
jgi:site-specific DNA-methyltransferase (adenine-specific)